MCGRYCGQLIVISIAYSFGSLSKWAGRPVCDSCYILVIVGARPKNPLSFSVSDFHYKYFNLPYYSYIFVFLMLQTFGRVFFIFSVKFSTSLSTTMLIHIYLDVFVLYIQTFDLTLLYIFDFISL